MNAERRTAAIEAGRRAVVDMIVHPPTGTTPGSTRKPTEIIAAVIDAALPYLVPAPIGYTVVSRGVIVRPRATTREVARDQAEQLNGNGWYGSGPCSVVALVPIEDQP